ncbi:MAG: hypothetical protein CBB71_19380 [Rhodopirellula sp. TMED11]|nr:MAG: hypothetical protein CBB71_19380 [Rhodopirellula sp. TMED11]
MIPAPTNLPFSPVGPGITMHHLNLLFVTFFLALLLASTLVVHAVCVAIHFDMGPVIDLNGTRISWVVVAFLCLGVLLLHHQGMKLQARKSPRQSS